MLDNFQVDVLAIADDVLIAGPVVACRNAVVWLQEHGALIGFHLNPTKSVAWAPRHTGATDLRCFNELGMDVQGQGITSLGAPIGNEEFENAKLKQWLEDGDGMLVGIQSVAEIIRDPHAAFLLLKYCYNARIGHLLRCVPTNVIMSIAEQHDENVERAFRNIHSLGPLADSTATQLHLPCRLGGLGVPSAAATAPLAYASS